MVYYAIALALYMGSSTREVLRCLLEGLRWLWGAEAVKVAGKSGISQARSRLGEAPLRRLYEQVVQPIATRASRGAWYRNWRLVSLDGSCFDVADTAPASSGGTPAKAGAATRTAAPDRTTVVATRRAVVFLVVFMTLPRGGDPACRGLVPPSAERPGTTSGDRAGSDAVVLRSGGRRT